MRWRLDQAVALGGAVLIDEVVCWARAASALRCNNPKAVIGHLVKIEIEVDCLDQLEEVLEEGADVVLLDNMGPDMLAKAVAMVGHRMRTEASGGVNLDTVAAIAEAGVDMISVGALTHSASVLDLGLDIEIA